MTELTQTLLRGRNKLRPNSLSIQWRNTPLDRNNQRGTLPGEVLNNFTPHDVDDVHAVLALLLLDPGTHHRSGRGAGAGPSQPHHLHSDAKAAFGSKAGVGNCDSQSYFQINHSAAGTCRAGPVVEAAGCSDLIGALARRRYNQLHGDI